MREVRGKKFKRTFQHQFTENFAEERNNRVAPVVLILSFPACIRKGTLRGHAAQQIC